MRGLKQERKIIFFDLVNGLKIWGIKEKYLLLMILLFYRVSLMLGF